MISAFQKHYRYYFSLFFILFFGILAITNSSHNRQLQVLVVVSTSFLYVLLALIHHYLEHDLTTKIVVEYILIGSLAVSAFMFLLSGIL
ncbi:MAG: hypothetical protein A3F31_03800 [Candidatus Levybacteria bacterium RIFCSPHIGHO2_12_FULL_38_12]|nr:MAG: hypothetical protein A2770_02195 [Candidatus Levybacteria bacterium RIFCSPHIGHO2_01_FULL_38_12]OGH21889.1 MAG: hypothetical protein A3D75_00415 [Candidatus Levybacteria bacterium RIFCSPHIGHO2_02_FULL_37_18]OGH22821.1 MAG: hypothetical protein A3F31_03800 [Candidatus Levybacteria bacterium RIFCSPHIGHO2_12_FULL_38_12]OGH33546.1 MAG: hypothetical protein A3A47_01760 [Candidatus Levybacteria bacterium RIFCSPLOWO2_01_FULL_37_20]OGH44467.1 MAG: hypothetical protein A3J14_03450 [Candidatus Lev